MTVIPASLASFSSSIIAGETYDVVTTFFLVRIAALITVAWYVYGISETTRSFLDNSASRAAVSVTSREIGLVFLIPSQSFFALSSVRQASGSVRRLFLFYTPVSGDIGVQRTDCDLHTGIAEDFNGGFGDCTQPNEGSQYWFDTAKIVALGISKKHKPNPLPRL
jgi:hypothetical protein